MGAALSFSRQAEWTVQYGPRLGPLRVRIRVRRSRVASPWFQPTPVTQGLRRYLIHRDPARIALRMAARVRDNRSVRNRMARDLVAGCTAAISSEISEKVHEARASESLREALMGSRVQLRAAGDRSWPDSDTPCFVSEPRTWRFPG